MAKSTNAITYVYEFEGRTIELTRKHVRTAYAKNGNVGNPTEYFVWDYSIDGSYPGGGRPLRSDAYEHARAEILGIPYWCDLDGRNPRRNKNVRSFYVVQDEMKANYRGRKKEVAA